MSATTGVGAVGMTLGILTGMIRGIVTALGGLIPAGIMARVGASVGVVSMQAGMILGGDPALIGAVATGAAVIIGDITIIIIPIDLIMPDQELVVGVEETEDIVLMQKVQESHQEREPEVPHL